MKKALLKDSLKEIIKSKKRFFSIMLMSLLGVGFFAGIRATSPDMQKTIDNYYKEHNVYDIQILSTLGLTEKDVELFKENEYVKSVYGTYSKDVISKMNDEVESVVKINAIEDVNTLCLESGRLPESENECVVEKNYLNAMKLNLGDEFEFENIDNTFSRNSFIIVGTVSSPLYLSYDRGTSSLGSGKVNYCAYVLSSVFDMDVYTQIYINIKNTDELITGSSRYNELLSSAMISLESLEDEVNNRRYNELILEANNKIKEAEDELNEQKSENSQKLIDAQSEIDSYIAKINNSESELNTQEKEIYNTFASYDEQIQQGKEQIEIAKNQLSSQREIVQQNLKEAINSKTSLIEKISQIDLNLSVLNQKKIEIYAALENSHDLSAEEIEYYKGALSELEVQIVELDGAKIKLNEGIYQIDMQVETANNQLLDAENEIILNEENLISQEKELTLNKSQAYSQIENGRQEIADARKTIEDNQYELNKNKEEFDNKIKEAEEKIIDAQDEVNNIEHPKLYILGREDNVGYSGFIQDTQSIENIGKVFPIVFFVVATLISLTSMTRMVEEQRQQIGTLKALGYTKLQISAKYILYASIATIIGGIIGMTLCFYILPKIIWLMYSMMYSIPNFVIEFNIKYGVIGLICAYICIVGATIYSCMKELVEKPAVLMRPKSPKIGKRVLLENIPFIWNRFNFTTKVTIRNMFRYKKRFLMTIIGIFGCTSLIIAGFGLKDSISTIIDNQYGKVFDYDYLVGLKSGLTNEEINSLQEELISNENVVNVVQINAVSYTLKYGENTQDAQAFIPNNNEDIYDIVNLKDRDDNYIKIDNNGIVITDKCAELLGVKEGENITIVTSDKDEIEIKVEKIVKNYIQHYMYMSKELYENLFGEEFKVNCLMVNNNDISDEESEILSKEMISNPKIASVTDINSLKSTVSDMMSNLNYVVWVLIISSGLLAFVVLYNLANVNISERIRELATIKVLGFYDNEVYDYVSKETIILTIIGIIIGMFGGTILTTFILKTCEINVLRFSILIKPSSYVFSALITILFTIIVNIVTYFTLKKIDMIESLKSVE